MLFKPLDPSDINITPFKVHKEFTLTEADSGSGVYSFRAISSSAHNFDKDTAVKKTYSSASFYLKQNQTEVLHPLINWDGNDVNKKRHL